MPATCACAGAARGGWYVTPPRHPLPARDPIQAVCTVPVANRDGTTGPCRAGITIPIRGRDSR